jgi:isopentenyl diphosphate isomerase/L-lactate dehydrogenase-like FMN-dependent dehydrogenase
VDIVSIAEFSSDERNNRYKLIERTMRLLGVSEISELTAEHVTQRQRFVRWSK